MSLLSVTVKKARYAGIQAQQYNSYVTLKLQNVKSTTVTVKGPNPCWEQDFLFETNDVNTGLLIEVWSKGMIWDRALGYNYIPLRDIQYSNEEGNGQWVSLDAELVMRDGEVVSTKTPTGDSLLLDCRFELPFGRYDPPSGWKCLLSGECDRKKESRPLGEEDNSDWLPFGRQNPPDHWSGRDAENTAGDALQRKLERLNSTIMGSDEQARRQHLYYGHSGYSEDSDYTSDLNYPIGQHPNSSASQFKTAAQLMRTPERSLETSRENSYERDDGSNQGYLQGSHYLPINHSNQQGRLSHNYKIQQSYRNYSEVDGEPLFYNSRPRDYKEYSSQNWYGDPYTGCAQVYEQSHRKKVARRRPSLERQTTLYDDQYYLEQQYHEGTDKEQYQIYSAQNYKGYHNQNYGYRDERYGEEAEDKQWDSGGYYYGGDYTVTSADDYQNIVNKKRSSKKLPSPLYSNSSQDNAFYTPSRGMSYETDTIDNGSTNNAASRRKLLKQQRQSSDNYSPTTGWQSDDKNTVWQSAEDYSYYDDYNSLNNMPNAAPTVITPSHPPKKRALPQIRAPSRNKASAVSLPQTPVRQLPNPLASINKQRVSAPVSRVTSADYEQNDIYDPTTYNENYNYAYASNDNLPKDKFGRYQDEIKPEIYSENLGNTDIYVDNYENKENYPTNGENYENMTDFYGSNQNSENVYNQLPTKEQFYDNYQEDNLKNYYDADVTAGMTHKKFVERRSNSPFIQQNTDSLESRDDELRGESFETAVDSICSSVPVKKQGAEYFSTEADTNLKFEPSNQNEIEQYHQQQQQQQQTHQLQYQQQITQQQQQEQNHQQQRQQAPPQQQQSTGMLGGLLGQLTKSPSQFIQQNQQQQQSQKSDQRTRDQPNLLTNPALAAMNVTKGFFSSITNAVNNTVQNINKQQKPQQQTENQVERIQVTKKGSLKSQESIESPIATKNNQHSFDSQAQDYLIPEEPEYYNEEKEQEYFEKQDDYYEYEEERNYYENEEEEIAKNKNLNDTNEFNEFSELDELSRRNDLQNSSRRANHLVRHDTIESEGKRSERSNRNHLRQQDSLDSYTEEIVIHNSNIVNGQRATSPELDRYDEMRTSVIEPMRNGAADSNHIDSLRKRNSGHNNTLIEPYRPTGTVQDVQKSYSPSPPSIQKQQSVDLEGIEEEEVPEESVNLRDEIPKADNFEIVQEEQIQVVVPERRKMTAKERWHRAYNVVVQQLNEPKTES